jgi:hemerythrin-like domain-containing protein
MSKAINDLKHEHEVILSSLQILDQFCTDVSSGFAPEKIDLLNFVGFLKQFTDTCHHGKEEGMLFPALIEAGLSEHAGPIKAMVAEHLQGKDYIREMDLAISAGPDYLTFAYAARNYSSLLKSHIQKEDDVLFPMAEKTLGRARLERMSKSFEEHEERVIGLVRHEQLHQLLKELRLKYLK